VVTVWCPAASSSMAMVLMWAHHPLALFLGAGCFIKCLFPLDQHIWSIFLLSTSDPFVEEELACWLVESERGRRHAGHRPLLILSGPHCF
jgi:hypothetical protein